MTQPSAYSLLIRTGDLESYIFTDKKNIFTKILNSAPNCTYDNVVKGLRFCSTTKEEMDNRVHSAYNFLQKNRGNPVMSPSCKLWQNGFKDYTPPEKLPPWFSQDAKINNYEFWGGQKDLVRKSLHGNSVGWFCECGSGKTLMALKLAEYMQTKDKLPIICVTELAPLTYTWPQHVERFCSGIIPSEVAVVNRPLVKIKKPTKTLPERRDVLTLHDKALILVNYERLPEVIAECSAKNIHFGTFIIDESHGVINPMSKRNFSASQDIAKKSIRVISMTGTPNPNSVAAPERTMIHLMQMFPHHFPLRDFYSFRDFMMYEAAQTRFRGIIRRPRKRFFPICNLMLKPFVHYLMKEEICNIPDKRFFYIDYQPDNILTATSNELEEEHRVVINGMEIDCFAQYQAMLERSHGNADDFSSDDEELLGLVIRNKKRQLCSGFVSHHHEPDVFVRPKKDKLINKEERLIDHVGRILGEVNEQILIWANYKETQRRMKKILRSAFPEVTMEIVNGDTSVKRKKEAVNGFCSGEVQVLLAHMASIGTGVTLFGTDKLPCRYMIIYEQTETGKDYRQAVDRVHRPGQTREVSVYVFRGQGTIEEEICQATWKKYQQALLENTI